MLTLLILLLVTTVVTTFFGYWAHKFLHLKLVARFSKSHEVHHDVLYPITDFKSDKYRSAGKDSTVIFFALASLPVLAIPCVLGLFGVLTLFQTVCVVACMLFIGWFHDYVHEAFHLNTHWFKKVPVVSNYFLKLEKMHYLHHVDDTKNFGILVFWWDQVFHTKKTDE